MKFALIKNLTLLLVVISLMADTGCANTRLPWRKSTAAPTMTAAQYVQQATLNGNSNLESELAKEDSGSKAEAFRPVSTRSNRGSSGTCSSGCCK